MSLDASQSPMIKTVSHSSRLQESTGVSGFSGFEQKSSLAEGHKRVISMIQKIQRMCQGEVTPRKVSEPSHNDAEDQLVSETEDILTELPKVPLRRSL